MPKTMSKEDKKWRGQNDARTLADAQEIKQDKQRLGRAVKEAKDLAKDAVREAKSMKRVATGKKK